MQVRLPAHALTLRYIVDFLKELGNRDFRRQSYREAIWVSFITFSFRSHIILTIGRKLYTQALDSADDTIPIEMRHILFADRVQVFVSHGDIHEALRDINLALSPEYSN